MQCFTRVGVRTTIERKSLAECNRVIHARKTQGFQKLIIFPMFLANGYSYLRRFVVLAQEDSSGCSLWFLLVKVPGKFGGRNQGNVEGLKVNFLHFGIRPNFKLQNIVRLGLKKILPARLEAQILPQRPTKTSIAHLDFLLTMPYRDPLILFHALPHLLDGFWCANRMRAIP